MATSGIEAELAKFDAYGNEALPASKMALYDGAGFYADQVKAAAASLPFKDSTVAQIQGAVGIAKFDDTGDGTGTSISFDGYFADSGFPIAYFVREVQIGTSRIPKIPFIRKATNACKGPVEALMQASFEQHIAELTGIQDI